MCNAQLQYSKLIGNNSQDFKDGFGGYLKANYPITQANSLSIELGINLFKYKKDDRNYWGTTPLKLGFLHTFNGEGNGLYIEPQVGYNIYGFTVEDKKFKGVVLGVGGGYLIPNNDGFMDYDIGLRYETAFHPTGAIHYLALRFTKAILLKKYN